jgi:WD40 repeat protein
MKLRIIISMFIFIASMAVLSDAQIKPKVTLVHDEGYEGPCTMAFSPDGEKIITGIDQGIVWDLKSGKKVLTIPADWIGRVAFSSDGSMIVSGSAFSNKKIWDAKTGELLYAHDKEFDPNGPVGIQGITFTPRGDKVIYIEEHGKLMEWDYKTGKVEFVVKIVPYDDIQFLNDDRLLIIPIAQANRV